MVYMVKGPNFYFYIFRKACDVCYSNIWKILGTYAFRLPDDNGEGGLWVSYEDPDTAGKKANYVK